MKMGGFVLGDEGWTWFNTLLFVLVIIVLSVKFYMPFMQRKRCGPCVNESTINTYCSSGEGVKDFSDAEVCVFQIMLACNQECVNVTINNEYNLTTLSEYMNLTNTSNGGESSK